MPATRLHLAVQYATDLDAPARAQVRRWVLAALTVARGVARKHRHRSIDDATLTIRYVDADEGRTLNRSYRGKDHATNVLTFSYEVAGRAIESDLVICLPVVIAEARAQRKDLWAHCAHLVIHGTLHACGYDHELASDADAMEAIERAVLARFRIDDPYRTAHRRSLTDD